MKDTGDVQGRSRPHYRDTDKASLGKDDVRADLLQVLSRFPKSLDHPERICQVFHVQITAEFACGNPIIGNVKICDQFFFDSVIGTDIGNFIAGLLQRRKKGDVRCYMPGCTASGENDFFGSIWFAHKRSLLV